MKNNKRITGEVIQDKQKRKKIIQDILGEKIFTTQEFNDGLVTHHEIERKQFLSNPMEERMPKLIIVIRKKHEGKLSDEVIIFAIVDSFRDEKTKYETMFKIGQEVANKGYKFPVVVYLHSEAWMSFVTDREKFKNGDFIMPRDDPNHAEVLITTGMTIDGRTNVSSSEIITSQNKKARFLLEPSYTKYQTDSKNNNTSDLMKRFWVGYTTNFVGKGIPNV